jgi:hypothetical protein
MIQSLFPLLLVLSAISFTVSYYKLYVLPRYATAGSCGADCGCVTPKKSFQQKFSIYTFWIGLVASTFFFSYFEYQNYKANTENKLMASTSECCATATDSTDSTTISSDTTSSCCAGGGTCE